MSRTTQRRCSQGTVFAFYYNRVVPENIHPPTTEGIGNSEKRGGGFEDPGNSRGKGGLYDRVSFQRDSRGPLIQ